MTNKELSSQIRKELAEKGIPKKAYSIRVRYAGYSKSINVEILDLKYSPDLFEEVIGKYERVRRCHVSHEILEGGNVYTHIKSSWESLNKLGESYLEKASEIYKKGSQTVLVNEEGDELFYQDCEGMAIDRLYINYADNRFGFHKFYVQSPEQLANGIALFAVRGDLKF